MSNTRMQLPKQFFVQADSVLEEIRKVLCPTTTSKHALAMYHVKHLLNNQSRLPALTKANLDELSAGLQEINDEANTSNRFRSQLELKKNLLSRLLKLIIEVEKLTVPTFTQDHAKEESAIRSVNSANTEALSTLTYSEEITRLTAELSKAHNTNSDLQTQLAIQHQTYQDILSVQAHQSRMAEGNQSSLNEEKYPDSQTAVGASTKVINSRLAQTPVCQMFYEPEIASPRSVKDSAAMTLPNPKFLPLSYKTLHPHNHTALAAHTEKANLTAFRRSRA